MPGYGFDRCGLPRLLALTLILLAPSLQAETRLDWQTLEQSFSRGAAHDQTWTRTWLGLYGGSALTGAVLASTSGSSTERYDARVRTVTSTLALADTLMNPQPHRPAYGKFRALREHDPERPLSLAQARALAREVALTEQHRQGWQQRLGALVVNTAAGLVIGVGDDRPRDGWSTALTGMLVKEVNIRTQPRTLSQTEGLRLSVGQGSMQVYPHFAVLPGQVAVGVRF